MTITGFLTKESGELFEKGFAVALMNKTDENTGGYAICQWFDNKDSYKTSVFNLNTLEVKE